VLRAIDLQVAAGEFVAIIGRSGCGKSTLLRLLAGLDQPTRGRIALGTGEAAGSARIMFQEPRLLPWARVVENVEVGVPEAETAAARRARALDLLAEVGLADRVGEWPGVLSGGQRQRVALARALASRPELLLLDEPLGALDALTRIEMQRLLERIWQQQGFTAVLVTHDVSEALALADRVVLIDRGAITLDLRVDLPRPRRRDPGSVIRRQFYPYADSGLRGQRSRLGFRHYRVAGEMGRLAGAISGIIAVLGRRGTVHATNSPFALLCAVQQLFLENCAPPVFEVQLLAFPTQTMARPTSAIWIASERLIDQARRRGRGLVIVATTAPCIIDPLRPLGTR
jgi:sulfonate transport system ATP-binding protein